MFSREALVVLTEKKIKETVGGSLLCRAIYLMVKANQPDVSRSYAENLLEKSMKAIEEAQEEEKRYFIRFSFWNLANDLNMPLFSDENSGFRIILQFFSYLHKGS